MKRFYVVAVETTAKEEQLPKLDQRMVNHLYLAFGSLARVQQVDRSRVPIQTSMFHAGVRVMPLTKDD